METKSFPQLAVTVEVLIFHNLRAIQLKPALVVSADWEECPSPTTK